MAMVQRFRATKLVTLSLLTATFLATAHDANAQQFPSRVITIVVPTAPATPPDIISRVIATELSESEGWQYRGREQGRRRADAWRLRGAQAPGRRTRDLRDGASGQRCSRRCLPNMPFKLETDFAPVIKVSTSYNVLVVNPFVPAKSVSDLVAIVKEKPDKLTFSSGGFGTPAHLVGEMFKLQTATRATHVPYNQFPQAIGDLLNGTNHFMFITDSAGDRS